MSRGMRLAKGLFITIIAIMFIAGCGAKVTNHTVINEDGSGYKEIVATISSEDIEKLQGGETALDRVIQDQKPEFMEVSKQKVESGIEYRLRYSFDSLDEYKTKTRTVTEQEPVVAFEKMGTILNPQYSFTDNTENIDLIRWALQAVIDAKLTSESMSNLYESLTPTIELVGQQQNFYGQAHVESVYNVKNIKVHTELKNAENIQRTVQFDFDSETAQALGLQTIQAFFESLVQNNEKVAVDSSHDLATVTVALASGDAEQINAGMNALLQTGDTSFSFSHDEHSSVFHPVHRASDRIDFRSFLGNSRITDYIEYTLEVPNKYRFTQINGFSTETQSEEAEHFGISSANSNEVVLVAPGSGMNVSLQASTTYTNIWLYAGVYSGLFLLLLAILALARWALKKLATLYVNNGADIQRRETEYQAAVDQVRAEVAVTHTSLLQTMLDGVSGFAERLRRMSRRAKDLPEILPQLATQENITKWASQLASSGTLRRILAGTGVSLAVSIILSLIISLLFNSFSNIVQTQFWQILFSSYFSSPAAKISGIGSFLGLTGEIGNIRIATSIPLFLLLLIPFISIKFGLGFVLKGTDSEDRAAAYRLILWFSMTQSVTLAILTLCFSANAGAMLNIGELFGGGDALSSTGLGAGVSLSYPFFRTLFFSFLWTALFAFLIYYGNMTKTIDAAFRSPQLRHSLNAVWYGLKKGLLTALAVYVLLIIFSFITDPGSDLAVVGKSTYGLGYIIAAPNILFSLLVFGAGAPYSINADIDGDSNSKWLWIFTSYQEQNYILYTALFVLIVAVSAGLYRFRLRKYNIGLKDMLAFAALFALMTTIIGWLGTIVIKLRLHANPLLSQKGDSFGSQFSLVPHLSLTFLISLCSVLIVGWLFLKLFDLEVRKQQAKQKTD